MQNIYSKNRVNPINSDKANCNMNGMHWNTRPQVKASFQSFGYSGQMCQQAHYSSDIGQGRLSETKVKHSDVEEGFAVKYLEFDQLPVLDKKVELVGVFQEILNGFESPDWLESFYSIDKLRTLNKSYPKEVNSIFTLYGQFILRSVSSPKPCLNKNILAFIYEVLLQSKHSSIDISIVLKFIDILVRKLNITSGTLKSLAENCMNLLLENCICDETIIAVSELAVDRNKSISKIAFHYIGSIVSILKERISELESSTLEVLFVTIGQNLESESSNNKTLAKNICRYFHYIMNDNYEKYVMFLYDQGKFKADWVHKFAKAVETGATTRKSFAEYKSGKMSKAPLKSYRNDFMVQVCRAGF